MTATCAILSYNGQPHHLQRGGRISQKSPHNATAAGLCQTPSTVQAHGTSFEAAFVPLKPDQWMDRLGNGPRLICLDRTHCIHSPAQPRGIAGVSKFCTPGDDEDGGLRFRAGQKLILVVQQHQQGMLPHA
jgi:hypothetical protein